MRKAIKNIYRDGIILRGSIYWDECLLGLNGPVTIYYPPGDLSRIFIFGPKMEWIGVAKRIRNLLMGFKKFKGMRK